MIDVVIPACRGLEATRTCVERVLAARCATPHELTVIDDASPEPGLSDWLAREARAGRFRLVAHGNPRGFVAAANAAFALHADRDVVLLDSGTEVPPGWLDRLAGCARREPLAATVTPFSNRATICGYPRFGADNPMPEGLDVAALDALFAAENRGATVDLPTGAGLCFYVTRRALEAVGPFDEAAFGLGFGGEVDFCMRAARAGLRHLLCGDLFVRHEGEGPPGPVAAGPRAAALALIDERYPEFHGLVQDFGAREPARPLRRRVDLARLRGSPRPRLLLVTHGAGGGVERHVRDLAALLAPQREVLVLRPARADAVELEWLREGEEFRAWFDAGGWSGLVALLRGLGVARVHVHHVDGLPIEVLALAERLGVPCDVTLHDFHPICPRYHLTGPDGTCCGGERDCQRCLESGPAQWDLTLPAWRATFAAFLGRADRVIAPSRSVATRIGAFFPEVPVRVLAHPEPDAAPRVPFKVAVLGAVSRIKGADLLEACARDAAARGLPLHFHVVGYLGQTMPEWPDLPLTVGGSYPEGRLDEALALARPHAALFLSQVPETWSYTLSAALRAGLPVAAVALGAFAERLEGRPATRLIDPDSPPAAVNDALLGLLL